LSRILVVDDRAVSRELLVTLLQRAGHETAEAADGVEALEAALQVRPDAMIVDTNLPRLDGLSFARAARARPELAATPILFYTASNGRREKALAASIPHTAVLRKPSDPELILRCLDEALGGPVTRGRSLAVDRLNFRLSALVEIGIELAAAASSRDLVETFSYAAATMLGADVVAVTVASEEVRRFVAGRRIAARWETLRDLHALERLQRECREARAIGPSDSSMALLHAPAELSAALAVCLETRRAQYGLLWFGKRQGEFSPSDLRFASTLAAQLALAYENVSAQETQAADFERTNRTLATLCDLAPVAIVILSEDGVVRLWNRAAERMFGWTAAEVVGGERRHLLPDMFEEERDVHERALAGETIASVESKRLRSDGTLVDVAISAAALRDPSNALLGVMEIFSDISRLKAVESELTQRAADLEALSARLVAAQEDERTRVSREIHDELGQLLTAAMIEISSMTPEQFAQRVPRALELLERTIESVRRIAADLRPALLDELGLVAAVENEVARFQERTGIECELSIRPASLVLDAERSTVVFRVVQEALTNVARHAEASRVEVRLRQSRKETLLQIRDDGAGIDRAAVQSGRSLGLIGIRERVRRVGGTVDIEGVPGRGTIFTVRIPRARE
jgi:two-component system, NarL family, sensor histidine kinase UhpB